MKNFKLKILVTLLSSIVGLSACNSGSGSGGATNSTNPSVLISQNTKYGETINALTRNGSVMFVAGDSSAGGSEVDVMFPGHNGQTETPWSKYPFTSRITAMKLSQDKWLYIATINNIYLYQYDYNTGALSEVSKVVLPSGAEIKDMAILPPMSSPTDQPTLLAVDSNNNKIWEYQIAIDPQGDETLIPVVNGSYPTGNSPSNILVHRTSKTSSVVYVSNSGDGSISQYTIQPSPTFTSVVLQPMQTANVTSGIGLPVGMLNVGSYLYVTDRETDSVSKYKIASDGSLSYVDTMLNNIGHTPTSIYTNPLGTYVYVFNSEYVEQPSNQNISQFTINSSNGDLVPIPTNAINIQNPNMSSNMSMTMDNAGHVYSYDTKKHTLNLYSTSADGSFSATVNNKDFCNYNANFYTASGISTTVKVPPCAAYVTLVAVGGGGGNGGNGNFWQRSGGGGGGGGATSSWSDSQGNVLVEGGGGGGGGGGDDDPDNSGGCGGGGGVAYLYNMTLLNQSITSLTGFVGGHGSNGIDAGNGPDSAGGGGPAADGDAIAGIGASGAGGNGSESNGDGGWGGNGQPTTQLPAGVTQQPGGVPQVTNGLNGLTLCGTIACTGLPNNTGLPNPPNYSHNNGNAQGVVGVLFTTYQIPENPWIPGGNWVTDGGCVVSPVFLQNYINWPGRPYQGAVQYVCPQNSSTGNGDRNYSQGWLYLPLDNDNPMFYNNNGTPTQGTPTQK